MGRIVKALLKRFENNDQENRNELIIIDSEIQNFQ